MTPQELTKAWMQRLPLVHDLHGTLWNTTQLDVWGNYVVRMDNQWTPSEVETRLVVLGLVDPLPDYFRLDPDLLQGFLDTFEGAPKDVQRDLVWKFAQTYDETVLV